MLESIHSPADVRALSLQETESLASEIRQSLIDTVALTGGHLASNLGAVELTLALHRALDTPRDKIIFDVGHQSYTHKLITGRQDGMPTLRTEGGMSGFPKRAESEYDVFETGHSSTALSAALGLARARDVLGEDYAIAALVGDGALTGGMCYEALNDAGSRPTQLIMLLNDNEMSIAHNVGALSKHLTRLRGSKKWRGAKKVVKLRLSSIPLVGKPLTGLVERFKRVVKLMLVPGEFFEAMGFGYLGPIDGHDVETLERALRDARAMQRPVVVHAVTQKGRGYSLAERQPERFHGVAPFLIENGKARKPLGIDDTVPVAKVVSETLVGLAEKDPRVLAITAAMPQGTGLSEFAERFPDRFFDVGIAEEHAVTMSAGMAAGGMRPFFAVYASFLQRAMDQLLHDVCLQHLPVTILVDHAGFVPGDGATHQGVYDLAMLRVMPGLTIWAPCDARELRAMLMASLQLEGPCVIRYPKELPETLGGETPCGTWRRIEKGQDVHIVAYGHSVCTALEAAALLRAQGRVCGVWSASNLSNLDEAALSEMVSGRLLVVLEEAQVNGGLGEALAGYFAANSQRPKTLLLGIENRIPGAHSVAGLETECDVNASCVASRIEEALSAEIPVWHDTAETTPNEEALHGQ